LRPINRSEAQRPNSSLGNSSVTLLLEVPELELEAVGIRLDCAHGPTGHFAHITDHGADQLAALGFEFVVNPTG
jgi:hypothetical protein